MTRSTGETPLLIQFAGRELADLNGAHRHIVVAPTTANLIARVSSTAACGTSRTLWLDAGGEVVFA